MIDSLTVLNALVNVASTGSYSIRGKNIIMECPNCTDDRGHFAVDIQRLLYHCWHCQLSGKIQFNNITSIHRSVIDRLRQEQPIKPNVIIPSDTHLGFINISDWPNSGKNLGKTTIKSIRCIRKAALEYCLNRGITPEQLSQHRVSVLPFENRVFFPYWDKSGTTVWFSGRSIDGSEPKTVEPSNSSKPLFGWHVRPRKFTFAVIVEGIFDYMVTPSSFAIMGGSLSDEQADLLASSGASMVFVIGDPDAPDKMKISRKRLTQRKMKSTLVHLLGNRDPNELGRCTMARLVSSLRGVDYNRSRDVCVTTSGNDVILSWR